MKVLGATQKPFSAAAVEGIREIVKSAGHEFAALEKYTDVDALTAAVADADALIPSGYAVLREGVLASYLTEEETLGAELLCGGMNGIKTHICGNTIEIVEGSAVASGQWDEAGLLTGIFIRCSLKAGVLEREAGGEKDIAVYLVANEDAVPFYEKLGMERADDVMRYNKIEWTDFRVE